MPRLQVDGAPGDFEVVVVTPAGQLEHWTKHNSAPWVRVPGEWYLQQTFGASIAFGGLAWQAGAIIT